MRQTLNCVSLCHPGVHVFLLIVPDAPLNNEDKAEMEEIQKIFSSRINKHIMILIMQDSEHQTAELNEETQSVIESFGGRHHYFGPSTQESTLMENIEQMLEENRGGFFSTETLLEAQMKKLLQFEEMKKKLNSLEAHLLSQVSRENTDDELRIVLLGKTGVGTGSTILGRDAFKAEASFESATKESQRETSEINGRRVTVIDTPGLFDTELSNEEIQREIRHCISMILPGPHVFLLLIPLGRFTKHEEASVKIIQETFGEKSLMYTMVLFTRGDDLKDKTIEECLGKPGSPLMKLIEACGNRYHVFNNNQTGDRTQVSDLLEKIDAMLKANGGSFYSCKMFSEMEREKQEQQMKILMDRVREREEEMKQERETFKHEIEQLKQENKKVKTEKEKFQIKYNTETERLMNRIENETKKEKSSMREEEYKTLMKDREEKERKMLEQMKQERTQWEKQKQDERQKREEEKIEQEKQKFELYKQQQSPDRDYGMMQKRQRVPVNIQDTPVSSLSPIRIVLLGRGGAGKSAAGNTILGQKEFRSEISVTAVTRECSAAHTTVSGRSVSVVDAPEFTYINTEQSMTEKRRSVYLSSPGPHAFLIVFPLNMWFTEHEQQIIQKIEMMFGQEVLKYSIILFTYGDLLKEETSEELIEKNYVVRLAVQQCGGRYQVFNNRDQNNRKQVNDLLQKIDTMIEQNGGGHYSNQMLEDDLRFRREEKQRQYCVCS
uniref:GTPase IMAP family member 8 n=2 Tax=Sinocyclocheilus anshuiensis TaxID=1608454 RepID=A0A671NU77_9TELE